MTEILTITSERVDDIPLLLAHMRRMDLPMLLESYFLTHGNRQGLDFGWTTTIRLDTHNALTIYLNGSVAAQNSSWSQSLSGLNDVNNWIGRSNAKDAPLKATIEEVRIYKVALDQAHVTASENFGPNPSFL